MISRNAAAACLLLSFAASALIFALAVIDVLHVPLIVALAPFWLLPFAFVLLLVILCIVAVLTELLTRVKKWVKRSYWR